MIFIPILLSLVFINLLLLIFSCDSGDRKPKKSDKKIEANTPKVWSNKTSSKPVLADK